MTPDQIDCRITHVSYSVVAIPNSTQGIVNANVTLDNGYTTSGIALIPDVSHYDEGALRWEARANTVKQMIPLFDFYAREKAFQQQHGKK